MNRITNFLLISCLFLSTIIIFANQEDEDYISSFVPCEKTYILSEQIHVSDDGIFILLKGVWYQTRGIQFDGRGLFFDTIYPDNTTWICPVCGQPNGPHSFTCSHCGAERPRFY